MTRALLVPVQPDHPVEIIELASDMSARITQMQELIGGWVERAVYDLDATLFVDEEGVLKGQAPNIRVNTYVWGHSHAAKLNGRSLTNPGPPLCGTAILTGRDEDDEICDVPDRLVTLFLEGHDPR